MHDLPFYPTPAMIDAGAQRLIEMQDNFLLPDQYQAAAYQEAARRAERIWRAMWLTAPRDVSGESLSGTPENH